MIPTHVLLLLACWAALGTACLVAGLQPPRTPTLEEMESHVERMHPGSWSTPKADAEPTDMDDLQAVCELPAELLERAVTMPNLERMWSAHPAPLEIDATVVALRVLVEVQYLVGPERVATARGIFTEITASTVTICDTTSSTTWVLARSMVLEVRPCAA